MRQGLGTQRKVKDGYERNMSRRQERQRLRLSSVEYLWLYLVGWWAGCLLDHREPSLPVCGLVSLPVCGGGVGMCDGSSGCPPLRGASRDGPGSWVTETPGTLHPWEWLDVTRLPQEWCRGNKGVSLSWKVGRESKTLGKVEEIE